MCGAALYPVFSLPHEVRLGSDVTRGLCFDLAQGAEAACCDLARGPRGDEACWDGVFYTFEQCCASDEAFRGAAEALRTAIVGCEASVPSRFSQSGAARNSHLSLPRLAITTSG